MAYIGVSPSNGVRRVFDYTATAGQTSFSGSDNNSQTLAYTDSAYIDVYQNGVLLIPSDYTATTGTSVVLDTGATVSDSVQIVAFDVFSVADTVSASDGGSFGGNVGVGGTLSVTGDATLSNIAGGIIFNDGSADVDFRVESDNNANAFFVQGSDGNVGIGTNSPNTKIHAIGATSNSSGIVDTLRLANTGESVNDGARILFTAGSSTSGAGIGSGGQALNSADLRFYAGGNTERCRINSSGYLYVATGGAEPSASQVGVRVSGTQGQNFWKSANSGTGGYDHLAFFNGNGNVGSIYTSGSSTSYGTSSDYRLKENVTYDFDATTRLKQLKPSRFNFIADKDTTVDGFLAHEVQSVVPEAISGEKDAVNEDGSIKPQNIDQSKIVPLLVKTIQELEARITALENA